MKTPQTLSSTTTSALYAQYTSISEAVTPYHDGDKGVLVVKYTGSRPLVVENPLLPLIAGLRYLD